MKPRVLVLTHFVSPYQVELFNLVAEQASVELFCCLLLRYLEGASLGTGGDSTPPLHPPHACLP